MAYTNDGTAHYEGIKNEKEITKVLNDLLCDRSFLDFIEELNFSTWKTKKITKGFVHIGGTKEKDDIRAIDISDDKLFGISVKQHKGATWDFFNTSKIELFLGNLGIKMKKEFKEIGILGKSEISAVNIDNEPKRIQIKKEYDKKLLDFSNKYLEKITSNDIKGLFEKIRKDEPELLIINNTKAGELHLIRKNKRDDMNNVFNFNKDDVYELRQKTNNAKQSRSIFKNNEDTGIRIRLVSNNGTSALIGMNDHKTRGNKSSSLTIKLQNDNVSSLYKIKDFIITNK